ncbi:rhodanese-like domain-containing protein [Streptomyces sp. NBC_01217]|uniref:rhodanese-like domain-containing protein n=1 Tax=Streptomyces sp. NBC_01217 TaxID=2903779 RepID=UPI002E0D59D2|nr:rhodanese-like domain-containing protein [Streptomyces sp. NBC_01217]
MACEADLEAFAAAWASGAFVLDVREPEEYRARHAPGAQLAPLSALTAATELVPKDRPVYVICASGNRSLWTTDRLVAVGVDAFPVAGGTAGWARSGRPLATGLAHGSV